MTFFNSLLFLFFLSIISTVKSGYSCKPSDTEQSVEIGNEITLCLHARTLGRKVAFKINVDDYTVISIEEGFSKLITTESSNTRRLENRFLLKEGDENETNTNTNLRDTNDGIKEEFIAQIGNVRTKYPTVIYIIYNL